MDRQNVDLRKFQFIIIFLGKEQARNELKKIEELEEDAKKIEHKILMKEKDSTITFKRAWVTFVNIKQRDIAYDFFFNTAFDRCLAKACCHLCCLDDYKKM